jgi:outer membrane protein
VTNFTIKTFIPFCILFGSKICFAQEVISLPMAISEALENNYNIQIAQQQVDAAENQIYKGNAGMTPIINWNTDVTGNVSQVNQVFLDDRKINRLGQSFAPRTSLGLNWTLYDGRRMQARYARLESVGQQSQLEKKLVIQNAISNVMQAYYEILRQKKSVEYLTTIIGYYNERLKITEERWQIGRGSKLDFLQSKADLNSQQASLVNALNEFRTAKIRLNTVLGSTADRDFEISELNVATDDHNLTELLMKAQSSNKDIILLNKSMELSLINQQEMESFRKPRIDLNSSFGYALSKNNAGFLALNQSLGLNTGVSATWNIFNGQATQRNVQLAQINTDIISKRKESLLNQIEADITAAYHQFQTDRQLLKLENENKEVAQENLTISLEKFKLGASTILELNDAQRRFDDLLNRLVNAQYNERISELELLRLSGALVE